MDEQSKTKLLDLAIKHLEQIKKTDVGSVSVDTHLSEDDSLDLNINVLYRRK